MLVLVKIEMMGEILFWLGITKEWLLLFKFILFHYSYQILLVFGLTTLFLYCWFKYLAVLYTIESLLIEIHVLFNDSLLVFLVYVIFLQNVVTIIILFSLFNYYWLIWGLLCNKWLRSTKLLLLVYPLELHLLFPLFSFYCFLSFLLIELLWFTVSKQHEN